MKTDVIYLPNDVHQEGYKFTINEPFHEWVMKKKNPKYELSPMIDAHLSVFKAKAGYFVKDKDKNVVGMFFVPDAKKNEVGDDPFENEPFYKEISEL